MNVPEQILALLVKIDAENDRLASALEAHASIAELHDVGIALDKAAQAARSCASALMLQHAQYLGEVQAQ